MRGPAPPAGSAVLMGPVGPAMSLGVLPLSNSESAEPVMPTRIQYSSVVELLGPLGPVVTLLLGEDGPGLCPISLTIGLLPGGGCSASGREGSDDCPVAGGGAGK